MQALKRQEFITVGSEISRRIYFRRVDPARPESGKTGVFLIPGFAVDCWGPRAESLADRCEQERRPFVSFAYSGFVDDAGNVLETVRNYTIPNWIDDAGHVFASQTEGEQVIAASSFGARAAIRIAQKYPEKVRALVLIAPAMDIYKDVIVGMLERGEVDIEAGDFPYRTNPPPGSNANSRTVMVSMERVAEFAALSSAEPIKLSCPVIILHDPKDPRIPYQSSKDLVDRIMSPEGAFLFSAKNIEHVQGVPEDYEPMWRHIRRHSLDPV